MLDDRPIIAIRTDGSASIGMGHVMRTLAVAEALEDLGAHTVFVCSDEKPARFISARGFEVRSLGTEPKRLTEGVDSEISTLEQLGACFVFVDSFFASDAYFAGLSRACPVGSFSFGKRFSSGLALMVSYLPGDDVTWMRKHFNENSALLIGESYVPLRREFRDVPRKPMDRQVRDILVMSGGSDLLGMSVLVLEAMAGDPMWDGAARHVVAGFACPHKAALRALAEGDERVTLHENVSDMAALMCGCDIAITACGFSCYELAACGVPMVAFATSNDQAENGVLRGIMAYAGDARSNPRSTASEAARLAGALAQDRSSRLAMRGVATEKDIDGRGAERIARAVLEIAGGRRL